MNLKLEAYLPADGVGIVRTGGQLRLVRPPFSLSISATVGESALQDALRGAGFTQCDHLFPDWESLIEFLNSEIVNVRVAAGHKVAERVSSEDVFRTAPIEALERFLVEVEGWITAQKFQTVEDFLMELLSGPAVDRFPQLKSQAAVILKKNRVERQRVEAMIAGFSRGDLRFPALERHRLVEKSAEWAKAIMNRRSVFAPAT